MNEIDNNKSHSFIWSYPFFYYTLLKHYRKEKHGVSDIAPWAAVCFLTMWCVAVYTGITLYLVGNCYPNYLEVKIFSEEDDWFNRALIFFALFSPNAVFFLTKNRCLIYEKKFDSLPLKVRELGIKISWSVMFLGILFLFFMLWWFTKAPC